LSLEETGELSQQRSGVGDQGSRNPWTAQSTVYLIPDP
jgi:hypothetical protein